MKRMFILLGLSACSNSAITYMHSIDPNAECQEILGRGVSHNGDSASCVSDNKVYLCLATTDFGTHCWPILANIAEQSTEIYPQSKGSN